MPDTDVKQLIDFYSETIDDRMEDGLSEEEAVESVGDPKDIAAQLLAETPLPKLVKAKVKTKRSLKAWEVVLLVLGAPAWLPLLLAAAGVGVALLAVVLAIIISLYAAVVSLAAGGVAGIIGMVPYIAQGSAAGAVFSVGAGFISAGLAILLLLFVNGGIGLIVRGCKKALIGIKKRIAGKGNEK